MSKLWGAGLSKSVSSCLLHLSFFFQVGRVKISWLEVLSLSFENMSKGNKNSTQIRLLKLPSFSFEESIPAT